MTVALVITSHGAGASVVPVLAALEAAGVTLRAIDLGALGNSGGGVTDRVKRAILGEGAERRLRREVEALPPDVALVFDPYCAQAMTVVRDAVTAAVPVVAVVASCDQASLATSWAQSDADRFLAADDVTAVALVDAGVEAERVVVVGVFGEVAFAAAGRESQASLRSRFKLADRVVLVAIAGLGPEVVGQLLLQLSLTSGIEQVTFLFDAHDDAEAAAVARRQVPVLGLRGKLFGTTSDAPQLWRAASAIVATPTALHLARAALLGVPIVALVDDAGASVDHIAANLAARGAGTAVKSALMVAGALEPFLAKPRLATPSLDGAANVADAVALVGMQKREVIEERRVSVATAKASSAQAAQAGQAAGQAAGAARAAPAGDLEDLGSLDDFADDGASRGAGASRDAGGGGSRASVEALRLQYQKRKHELGSQVSQARSDAERHAAAAAAARRSSDDVAATLADKAADAARGKMHSLLAELATLDRELAELDQVAGAGAARGASSRGAGRGAAPRASVDDELARLKSQAAKAASGPASPSGNAGRPGPTPTGPRPRAGGLDDELAALKRKMAQKPK